MSGTFSEEAYLELTEHISSLMPSFGLNGSSAYKPGLERSLEADRILGCPSKSFRSIHVAGTNGKGSVCNMLAANLAAAGLTTGLYTSPHILDFRERMRIVTAKGFTLVPKEWIWDFYRRFSDRLERIGLSFFEFTTAMCFKWFSESGVDVAVIETGLGGRLDSTNIITPRLSVITNIGYDHMDILGGTLAQIAAEKAGIIKDGIPVVIGESSPETDPVFEKAAASHHSKIVFADTWDCPCHLPEPSAMDLSGDYQRKNVRTVACALDMLGLQAVPYAIARAAHICGFHARWETIRSKPLTICDIGHNEHGLKYNFSQLERMLEEGIANKLVMVYGSVRDKDVDAVLRILPAKATVFFCAAANPRALEAGELLRRSGRNDAQACGSVLEALTRASKLCGEDDVLYIGGSTYVVSEALSALGISFPDQGSCGISE